MNAPERPTGPPPTYSRRTAIGLGAAALAGAALATEADPVAALAPSPVVDPVEALRPDIRPRADWGADAPVSGAIVAEDDVRFLLVHHTASTNDYQPSEVADQIRSFHRFHTGEEKGWPDVAYNFFVDRFGGIWEARQGSIDGPVRGDATGGSQGFALLCSLIGNHSQVPVTDEARASLTALLAWLAERHGIETEPGTMTDFVSRGSNRWPAGATVSARTISGHRDMSQTSCPGDFAYDLLATDLPRAVTDRRAEVLAGVRAGATPAPALVEPEPAPSTTTSVAAADPTVDDGVSAVASGEPGSTDGEGRPGPDDLVVPAAAAGGAAAALAALAAARRRRSEGTAG